MTLLLCLPLAGLAQNSDCLVRVAKLKYQGGGDWYANPSSLPNLLAYVKAETRLPICLEEEVVEPSSQQVFQYSMLYMTGHGNVIFTEAERENLRTYLIGGGFLLIDDNYGMQEYARRELAKLFPEAELLEIPRNHPIYSQHYAMPEGMPKIHEHDGKPASAYGIIWQGRLVCMLTFEADLGDGWEDPDVHNDPPELRAKALQMGANVLLYACQN